MLQLQRKPEVLTLSVPEVTTTKSGPWRCVDLLSDSNLWFTYPLMQTSALYSHLVQCRSKALSFTHELIQIQH